MGLYYFNLKISTFHINLLKINLFFTFLFLVWNVWDIVVLAAIDLDQCNIYEQLIRDLLSSNYNTVKAPLVFTVSDPYPDASIDERIVSFYKLMVSSHDNAGDSNGHNYPLLYEDLAAAVATENASNRPRAKVGAGGAAFHVLDLLVRIVSRERLFGSKVLLIYAGGYSQRSPQTAAIGKLLLTLPIGLPDGRTRLMSFLELKLAQTYLLGLHAPPGILNSASDDLQTYDINCPFNAALSNACFSATGFTALAHPTVNLSIASGHGVYVPLVAEDASRPNLVSHDVFVCQCERVLQKPDKQQMRSTGAFISPDILFPERRPPELQSANELVLVDSMFYMSHAVTERLLAFSSDPDTRALAFSCESDVYHDWLQALGRRPSDAYITSTATLASGGCREALFELRRRLYALLGGTELKLVVLSRSEFFHLGTTPELLDNLCEPQSERFQRALCLTSLCCARVPQSIAAQAERTPNRFYVMASVLHENTSVAERSLLEFCDLSDLPVSVGASSVLSHLCFKRQDVPAELLKALSLVSTPDGQTVLPDGLVLQTVAIRWVLPDADSQESHLNSSGDTQPCDLFVRYVTFFVGQSDPVKKTARTREQLEQLVLTLCGVPLSAALGALGLSAQRVFPELATAESATCEPQVSGSGTNVSHAESEARRPASGLWTACLFPALRTRSESLAVTLLALNLLAHPEVHREPLAAFTNGARLFSMADMLQLKHVSSILRYRRELKCSIASDQH